MSVSIMTPLANLENGGELQTSGDRQIKHEGKIQYSKN